MAQLTYEGEVVFDEKKCHDMLANEGWGEFAIDLLVAHEKETFAKNPEKYYLTFMLERISRERNIIIPLFNNGIEQLRELIARIETCSVDHLLDCVSDQG